MVLAGLLPLTSSFWYALPYSCGYLQKSGLREKLLSHCWKPPLIFNLNNLTFVLPPPQGSTGIFSGRTERPFEVADLGHVEAAEVPIPCSMQDTVLFPGLCAD